MPNISVYGVLVTGSGVDTLSQSDEKHCKVMWRLFSHCPCGREGGGKERIGGMEVGELYTLDKCCLEAYVPHAQPVLHHPSISKDQGLLEKERSDGADVKEKAQWILERM